MSRLVPTAPQWAAIALCAALGLVLFAFVDLTPEVETDFFFSTDDPQLQGGRRIERDFGSAPQIFIAARSERLFSAPHLRRILALTADLQRVAGVVDIRSLTRGPEELEDVGESPFWSRLLLAPDRSASFIVLRIAGEDQARTVAAIDQVLERHSGPDFLLGASGAPYVAEHIRVRLTSELRRFSIAAFAAFALLVALLFRSVAVVAGTMVAALTASFGTFLVRALLGMRTDILAPNLWTIAFVLTISHIVYLTAYWQRLARDGSRSNAVGASIRFVGPASVWSLAATLLGFASLIVVSAKPLQQFGVSGVIAAVLAIACAYLVYPPFLRAADPGRARPGALAQRLERVFTARHPRVAMTAAAVALAVAPFARHVDTDPTLPSYFADGDPIRTGIEAIDRAGGSSPLDLVVADARGQRLDDDEIEDRLQALQRRLERHPDVGSVLSIALLMGEAERPWYSFLFSWETKLEALDQPEHGRIGRTFITQDRRRARYILRMDEAARSRPRAEVVREIEGLVRAQGFRPVVAGGLYPLQGELSELVRGSVIRGLGGLLAAFAVIVLVVTRSARSAVAMTACLAVTPLALFGLVGLARMPLDIIAAPAANVALPLGIDEMIHLGHRVRHVRGRARGVWDAWQRALAEMRGPILASMLIVTSGFALFLLSDFPPTRRLGVLVCIGAALTDLVVLVILPVLASRARRART
ncbi:MAG: MMPL family transporter [Acidobacteria bacterium]|nr:MMPL family transporter [Acidobacteriota bacterium]